MTRRPKLSQRRTPWALIAATGALLLLSAGVAALFSATPAGIGGPFRLTATDGTTVTERSFAGQYILVYFGYASCPDVCPTALAAVADALHRLGERGKDLQPLFVTVDPRRDTPDILRRYLAAFSPRVLGLTGTPSEVRRVEGEYRVSVSPRADATIEHSSVLYLMGPAGNFLAPIRADASGAEMADVIRRYIA